jgi:peptidyl-prolyl cis-trans isomerase D
MATKKKSAASKLAVWVIVGLLMFGMIGFGAAGFNGTQRSLGTVGDKTVSITSYSNALRSETSRFQEQLGRALTQQEVQTTGIDQQALNRVINTRALDQLVTDLGLSAGDERVRAQVVEIPAFQGLDGQFDRVAYAEVLQRNNLKEADFETSLREDTARRMVQQAVLAGINMPSAYSQAITSYISETRDFSWARVTQNDLVTGTPVATDADLVAYHTENPDQFTTPAAKTITYIWLTPDMMAKTIDISNEALQAAYEARSDEFIQLPSRLVERVIFSSKEEAQDAMEAITEGAASFEQVVQDRGLNLQDVDLGDVTEAALGDAGALVFGLAEPGVIGPADTDLGPALFRVNAILDGNVQTFEIVKEQLRIDAALDAAIGEIAAISEEVDDLLAGGATLEDVAAESQMELGIVDWHLATDGGISNYEEFQTAAAGVTVEDFPTLATLSDNGLFAIRFEADVPAVLQSLAHVRDDVSDAWAAQTTQQKLLALAENIAPQVSLYAPLASFGLIENIEDDMMRSDSVDDTPPILLFKAFETALGSATVLEDADGVIVLISRAEHAADLDNSQVKALQNILGDRINAAVSQDIFESFSNAAREAVNVNINQATLRSVNSSLLGGG